MIKRKIISKKRFDDLVKKGVFVPFVDKSIRGWEFKFIEKVRNNYTPLTVGKQPEKDFNLVSIHCVRGVYDAYVNGRKKCFSVDFGTNPYEPTQGYYVPEWLFVDRQKDVDDIIKRYFKEA